MATMVTDTPAGPAAAQLPPPPGPRVPLRGRLTALAVRFRLALVCVGFLVLALLQAPGRIVGDTKIDLAVDPLGFLGRALTLWEPLGSAGQVQNQAYGYFFPMGPFFALGDLAGLPVWVVQRLWWAALMSVAFTGIVVLARRLRIGTPATALVAGIAYALAPRMVTEMGETSIELVPMALAPWVIVPLAGAVRHGSARRAATLSALAVFCVGGVNAVATAAVLPLAVLFLLTRPAGPLRRRLLAWWVPSVALAVAWWAGPLVLLGKFSPPFLYYIENAHATTFPTSLLSALRGTSHWIAGLASPTGPTWPAGWALIHDALPVAGTVVLVAAGVAGLCRRDLPERLWLVLGLLAGVGLVTLGHLATVQGLWAQPLHDALDGALAPLRNVHKFELIVRLPLVLGAAHLGAVLLRWAARRRDGRHAPAGRPGARRLGRVAARGGLVAVVLALVATVSPAVAGQLAPPTGFTEVPGYWRQTAAFLEAEQPSGRALLVPGSSFGTYRWGSPNDEVIQPLAESAWDVRSAIPLSPEAHIRVLDAIEERLALGEGSEGLARYLARAGISHLVLRNDLDASDARSTRSALVRQSLRLSPGIAPVASFGPLTSTPVDDDLVWDAGLEEEAPAIEVYAVADPAPRAYTTPLSEAVTVVGGPEAVLALEEHDLITGRPTLMAGSGPTTGPAMVTDALIRRERNFGRLDGAVSGALSVDDEPRLDQPVRDYVVSNAASAESVVRYIGATPTASSSASDPDGFNPTRLETQPFSAADGDPTTAWRPAPWDESGEAPWWRLTTDRQFVASTVVVSLGEELGVARPRELRLTTDAGSVVVPVADTGDEQTLPLPQGYTSALTIAATTGERPEALALAEVRIPGVSVQRTVVVPPAGGPVTAYAFDAERGRSGCVVDTTGVPRCAGSLISGTEEPVFLDRTFSVPAWADYDLRATGVARPGAALDELLTSVRGTLPVTGSSSAVADPRGSPVAALDGDPTTSWIAAGDDPRPTLVVDFPEERTVGAIRVITAPGLAAAVPTAITIDDGSGLPRTVALNGDGLAEFVPVTTSRLSVSFDLADEVTSLDPGTRWEQRLGVGVSELQVGEANPVTARETSVVLTCESGGGPTIRVDAAVIATEVRTTVGELLAGTPVRIKPCDTIPALRLPPGEHRIQARSSDALAVDSVQLTRFGRSVKQDAGVREPVELVRWDPEHRVVDVAERSEPTLLVVPENPNPGWTATLEGQALEAVTVDGWQQGYVLPAGPAGTVRLDYPPGSDYRTVLAAGAGAVLLLVVLAVLPVRRTIPVGARRGSRRPALGPVLSGVAIVAAGVFGTALVGGVFGLAALAGAWLLAQCSGRWRAGVLATVAAGALLTAGGLLIADPDATATGQQVAAVVALAAVVAGVLPGLPSRRTGRRVAAHGARTAGGAP
ncbi:alpha-(1-_3)-arabinofuranosyltransferase [Trujillonella endophytica]|uniref:Arabinofuranan 3-O-arabinosyltransferase n=1 Tax=Trujillonella endophytica TaxID=673521 RepID=A0A1H8PRR1_9ACTN|nr:alpha-(1->3)-arabinofuranosyltransferase [Trujillella endophytica]SEO44233.1 arabinofuranan 3-O-arabinosyltransferase [Trujillella endophytica]